MSKTRRNIRNGTLHINRIEDILKVNEIEKEKELGPDLSMKRPVQAKTDNQKRYLKSIKENDITFCIGPAGTGKTHLGIGMAAYYLSKGINERIFLARPAVSCDEDQGFLPGDLMAKLGPYLRPAYDELLEFFTFQQINHLTGGKFPIIEGLPLGMIKGRTFKRSLVILDEAQDATYAQLKNFLTRMGEGTKVIVTGDIAQSDRFKEDKSPLVDVMNKMHDATGVGFIRFTPADIQRHPRIEQILSRL